MLNITNKFKMKSWFKDHKRFLIICNLCLLLLSFSYYVFSKRIYSSSALIRIGQVAHIGKIRNAEEGRQILVPISVIKSLLEQHKYPESDALKVKIEIPWVTLGEIMNKLDAINVIPEIGQIQLLESPTELSAKIIEKYKNQKKEFPILASINSDLEDKSMIYLKTVGNTPEEAKQFLSQILESIIQEHQLIYSEFVNINQQYYSELMKEINLIQKNRSIDDGSLLKLKKEAAGIKILSSKVYSRPTELINQPSLNYIPTKPKLLYVILIVILGNLIGLLLTLLFKDKD